MRRSTSIGCWVALTLWISACFFGPAVAQDAALGTSELRLMSEMNAELRSLNSKADRLANIDAGLEVLQQRVETLIRGGWEYRFLPRNRFSDIQEQADSLGREGWELVAVTEQEGLIFKRRLVATR